MKGAAERPEAKADERRIRRNEFFMDGSVRRFIARNLDEKDLEAGFQEKSLSESPFVYLPRGPPPCCAITKSSALINCKF
jgi:hypothetical protein